MRFIDRIQSYKFGIVLKIDKNDFGEILKATPKLAVVLSQSLSRRIRSQVTRTKTDFESSIISIYSPIKGSGSSTYAINLALSLQRETNKKVLFMHLTSVQNAKGLSGAEVKEAAPQWKETAVRVQDIVGDHQKILQAINRQELNIDVLNAVFDMGDGALVNKISQFVSGPARD